MNLCQSRWKSLLGSAATSVLLLAGVGGIALAEAPVVTAWNILDTATSDPNLQRRSQSVSALGLIPRNAHAEELAIKALSDDKPEVRAAGANALGGMEDSKAIPELTKALQDTDAGVVLAAAHSLLLLKDKVAYNVYYAVLTGERKSGAGLLADQKKMLNDPKKMEQFGFETVVGFIPFGGLTLAGVKALTKDDVSPVRAAAAKILANDPDPKSGEALVNAASDPSWIVRAAALDAIAHRGERSLASQIVDELTDQKDVVKYIAAAAIIRLNEERPAPKPARK